MINRIIICKIRKNLNYDFDHLFIKTTLDVSINIAFFEKKIQLKSFKQNQIRRHYQLKAFNNFERNKHVILKRLYSKCMQSHYLSL